MNRQLVERAPQQRELNFDQRKTYQVKRYQLKLTAAYIWSF